eukprot:10239730-Ditylum_brightwellii.AAC.1
MQLVKVSANLVFHNFNKLAQLYADFPKSMKGKQTKKILNDNAVIPLTRDNPLHVEHGLQSGKVTNKDL